MKSLTMDLPPTVPRKRRFKPEVTCAVIAIVILATVPTLVWFQDIANRFDRQVWLANPDPHGKDNARYRMVEDLMRNHLKKGMPQKQVREMLGEPDAQSLYEKVNNIDSYNLGYERWWGIDPSYLQIKYDKNSKVISFDAHES
jgi:hypothetical protein